MQYRDLRLNFELLRLVDRNVAQNPDSATTRPDSRQLSFPAPGGGSEQEYSIFVILQSGMTSIEMTFVVTTHMRR
jgi:hypothetical protein